MGQGVVRAASSPLVLTGRVLSCLSVTSSGLLLIGPIDGVSDCTCSVALRKSEAFFSVNVPVEQQLTAELLQTADWLPGPR